MIRKSYRDSEILEQSMKLCSAKGHLNTIVELLIEYNPLFEWSLDENDREAFREAVFWNEHEKQEEGDV